MRDPDKLVEVKFDFRWTAEPLASEPVTGMSESLAEGLVSRFVDEWTRSDVDALVRHPPPQTQKRAAAYRAFCEWLLRSVPVSLQIMTIRAGSQNGKDKSGRMALVHWQPDPRTRWLMVVVQTVSAQRPGLGSRLLAKVSRHALVRLFQRLRTDDPRVVLDELAPGMKSYFNFAVPHIDLLGRPDIMVPTRRGAVAVGADESDPFGTVVKTWISDERMEAKRDRLRAVQRARAEDGFVLMVNGGFIVMSSESLKRRVTQEAIIDCIRRQLADEADTVWNDQYS